MSTIEGQRIVWASLAKWFVYELSGYRFESRCCHLKELTLKLL